jgi:hypothetical protein
MKETTELTKKCPSCDETISAKTKRCPHCRQDLRSWPRRHPILTILLVLLTSPIWIAAITGFYQGATGSTSKETNATPAPEHQTELTAYVNFDGTQFIVSNVDKYTCQNARMQVNGDYTLEGYDLDSALDSTTKTGEATVYKLGAGQFTKNDGTRLNPFAIKPKNFSISCRGDNELSNAFGYWEFK